MGFISSIIVLTAVYLVTNSGYKLTTVQGGSIWGMAFPMSESQKAWRKKNTILLIVGIVLFLVFIIPSFGSLLFLLAAVIGVPAVLIIGTKKAVEESKIMAQTGVNLDALGEISLMRAVEEQLGNAQAFILTYEGIGLTNAANYCFASFMYNDYKLGNLTDSSQLHLLATYFSQKYSRQFEGKPSWDRTFYPGQKVTYLGVGGVYTEKTPSSISSELNSYIFTRVG